MLFVAFSLGSVPFGNAFFEKGFFANGNTLWDELYKKCGNRVSFYCVQDRLMNYINDTLDSDLRITEGINFVKSNHEFNTILDADSHFSFDNNTEYRMRRNRAVKILTTVDDNEIVSNVTESYPKDEEEAEFGSFVKIVEKIENDLESEKKQENSTETTNLNSNSNSTENTENEEEESRDNNLVIRSLNKVSDLLYDKTSNYLSSHDLRLDLPQTFFGGSKMVVSPRGFDEDGGIILKINFNPAETPRSGSIAKYYFRKCS